MCEIRYNSGHVKNKVEQIFFSFMNDSIMEINF